MILIWMLWVVLVLGGLVAVGSHAPWLRGPWLRAARVPARVRRPVWQRQGGNYRSVDLPGHALPPPRVVTRAGPPPRPLT